LDAIFFSDGQEESEEAVKAVIRAERARQRNARKRKEAEEESKEAVSKEEHMKDDTMENEATVSRSPSPSMKISRSMDVTRSMDVSRSTMSTGSRSRSQYSSVDDVRPPKVHLKVVQVEVEAGRPLDLVLSTNLVIRTVSKYSIAFYSVIVGDQVSLPCSTN
ncbi:hypothetical protein COOONC_14498, partial [Cooperia oncophora]